MFIGKSEMVEISLAGSGGKQQKTQEIQLFKYNVSQRKSAHQMNNLLQGLAVSLGWVIAEHSGLMPCVAACNCS